jgi:hypothetical protein
LHGKHIITVLLALLVLVPASASYAQNQDGKGKQVEKFIELAERAKEKTELLINITCANATAIATITSAGFFEELEANVTDFNDAAENITNAYACLEDDPPDYEGATANITYALEVFRDIFKAVKAILAESGVEKGQLLDGQGLLQAIERALERIEALEAIEELPVEVEWLLGNATLYLDVTKAIERLQLGMVNQTAHNLTAANRLISEAYKALKKTAGEMNTNRIRNFFKVMNNTRERLSKQVNKLNDPSGLQETLSDVDDLIGQAQDAFDNEEYSEALELLEDARALLDEVEQGLKEQRRAENGNGKGGGNGP